MKILIRQVDEKVFQLHFHSILLVKSVWGFQQFQ